MPHIKSKPKSLVTAVDLFCGAGGLTHGLKKVGVNVIAGYDIDEACKWPYEKNNKGASFQKVDISTLSGKILKQLFKQHGGISLLAGCAPCQPFSTYSLSKTSAVDERWSMLNHFARLVREVRPKLVTMENVPQLKKHGVFNHFKTNLERLGYSVSVSVVDCTEYGIPQSRIRLVLLASLLGDIELRQRKPSIDRKRTVRHAIAHLPSLRAGSISKKDPLHRSSSLTPLNRERILASKPGGTWRDWNADIVADCHKDNTGKTFPGVYGRMEWDKPAPTITTQFFGFGNGRFGHPQQNRALSLREGAILQTFPARYSFAEDRQTMHMKSIGRLIGNAVPVKLGKVIGESILLHVKHINR